MISKIEIFGTTDVGQVRDHNEDNFVICKDLTAGEWNYKRNEKVDLSDRGSLLVVADGMGGTNAGEVASHLAQEAVKDAFDAKDALPESDKKREQLLVQIIKDAHDKIVKHQQENLETAGMGTTLVIAWIIENKIHVGWSGDSRCYIFRGEEKLTPFTDDHSLVWDLVKAGEITAEEARNHPESNIITQSLGEAGRPPKPSSKTTKLYEGDKLMVCSDGLNGMLSDDQIRYYLAQEKPVDEICKELTEAANQAGGTDNITVLMAEILEGDERPADLIPPVAATSEAGLEERKDPNEPTRTQVLRNKVSARNYLLGAAILVVIALLIWIMFFQNGNDDYGTRTVINVNGKSYEFVTGEQQELELVPLITEGSLVLDSFSLDGLDYSQVGNNGKIAFMIDDEKDRNVKVKLFPKSKDTVFIASVLFKPKPIVEKPMPANQSNKPTRAQEEAPPRDQAGLEEEQPGGEKPMEKDTTEVQNPANQLEQPLEDTTETMDEPLVDTIKSEKPLPGLNKIEKEKEDTTNN